MQVKKEIATCKKNILKDEENEQLFQRQRKQKIKEFFDNTFLNQVAKATGFIQRKPQKITALAFVPGFIERLTTQALFFERMSEPAVAFLGSSFCKGHCRCG